MWRVRFGSGPRRWWGIGRRPGMFTVRVRSFPGGLGVGDLWGFRSVPTHFEADFPERFGEAYESYWSLSSRLKHMDEEGTDIMVGFPTTGGVATSEAVKDPALQAALCRAY